MDPNDPGNDPNAQNQGGGGGDNVRQMREAINRKDQRISELESQLSTYRSVALDGIAHRAGYDPSDGPVQLVMEKYEAELTPDKLSPSAFVEFAKNWNVLPKEAPAPQQQPQQQPPQQQGQQPVVQGQENQPQPQQQGQEQQLPVPDPNTVAQAQQVQQVQAPADQLLAASQSAAVPQPGDIQSQIAKAEAEGRWDDAFNLKIASTPQLPPQFGQTAATGANPNTGLPTHTPPEQQ